MQCYLETDKSATITELSFFRPIINSKLELGYILIIQID